MMRIGEVGGVEYLDLLKELEENKASFPKEDLQLVPTGK